MFASSCGSLLGAMPNRGAICRTTRPLTSPAFHPAVAAYANAVKLCIHDGGPLRPPPIAGGDYDIWVLQH